MKTRNGYWAQKRLKELEERIRRGELVEARTCRECDRGYTYCAPFDRWIPEECPRRPEALWNE